MAGLPDDQKEALTELRRRVAAPQVLCRLHRHPQPPLAHTPQSSVAVILTTTAIVKHSMAH